jgi:outer-membrane receptor for ferric coprogen and ferric-rhodotorulic acid
MRPMPLHQRFTPAPLALATAATIAMATGHVPRAHAQGSTATAAATLVAINIPAQPLGAALNELARQANLQMTFPAPLVAGKQAPAVSGQMTGQQALARMLAGSGLVATTEGRSVVVKQELPLQTVETVLPTVRATAQALRSTITEESGSYAANTDSRATGLSLSLRETPQTVTVVTHQQMRDQGTNTIAEVMQNAGGINTQRYDSERWMFSARGFVITNFTHDGVLRPYDGIYDWGVTNQDMVFYDRVEIVKGATGLLSGSGMPSAAVNFVRKRPGSEPAASVSAQLGSWDHRRLEADVSVPLSDDKAVRGRVAGAYQDRGSAQDHYRQKLSSLYGVVEAELTPATLLTWGADYQHVNPRGSSWTGLPVFYSDGSRTQFSRSMNPATDWSRRVFTNSSVFAMLEHQFSNSWSLKAEVNHLRSWHRTVLGSASGGYPDPQTGLGMYLFSGKFEGNRAQNTVHANLEGKYEMLGRRHDAAFGMTWTDTKTDGPTYAGQYPVLSTSIFDWDGRYPESEFDVVGDYADRSRQTGLYASTRLRPTDRLAVIMGARASHVELQHRESFTDGRAEDAYKQSESELIPYAGLVYELDGVHALYASYTSIFEPQSLRTMSGDYLDPLKGKAYEVGMKADYLKGALQASMALFRIQQDNLAEYAGYVGNSEERYRAIKGVHSQGIELQLAGRLTPRWNINASYTYGHIRSADGQQVYGSQLMTTQPAHMARLFSTYRLSEGSTGWKIGGGISWQSSFEGKVWPPAADASDYAIVSQQAYALVDLNAEYQFTPAMSANLVVRNVFNKDYLNSIGLFETAYRGEPRNAMLTLNYKFQ